MMTKQLTEESFLADLIGSHVAIYLVTGIRLLGVLSAQDDEAVFLRPHGARTSEVQMIYKLAISTIASAPSSDARSSIDDFGGTLSGRVRRGGI